MQQYKHIKSSDLSKKKDCLQPATHRDHSTIFKSISSTSLKSQPSLSSLAVTNTVYCIYYSFSSSLELEYISAKGSKGHLSSISFNTKQKLSKISRRTVFTVNSIRQKTEIKTHQHLYLLIITSELEENWSHCFLVPTEKHIYIVFLTFRSGNIQKMIGQFSGTVPMKSTEVPRAGRVQPILLNALSSYKILQHHSGTAIFTIKSDCFPGQQLQRPSKCPQKSYISLPLTCKGFSKSVL